MKTIKTLLLATLLAFNFSCSKSDDSPAVAPPVVTPPVSGPIVPATGSYIFATADGAFSTLNLAGQHAVTGNVIGTGSNRIFYFVGGGSNGELPSSPNYIYRSITIQLGSSINAVGTYAFDSTTSSKAVFSYLSRPSSTMVDTVFSTQTCAGTSGTVTITAISDTMVEGTFSFTGKNDGCALSKTVTAGSFRFVAS